MSVQIWRKEERLADRRFFRHNLEMTGFAFTLCKLLLATHLSTVTLEAAKQELPCIFH